MSVVYSNHYQDFSGEWELTNDLFVSTDEEYMEDGIEFTGDTTQIYLDGQTTVTFTPESIDGYTLGDYACGYIYEVTDGYGTWGELRLMTPVYFNTEESMGYNTSNFPFIKFNSSYYPEFIASLSINIPIFDDVQYANQYIGNVLTPTEKKALIRLHALNYLSGQTEQDGREFEITNPWQHGTWTTRGPAPDTPIAYRNVRGKIIGDGKVALYRIGLDGGSLKMGVKIQAVFSALEYSTDGVTWQETDSFPFEYFYAPRIKELGTFNYGLALGNNQIPEWDDEEDADDFIDGVKPIEDANNWDILSPSYPDPKVPGTPDNVTQFGEVGARSIFSQQYVVPLAVMYEIANTFYDTTTAGLWDDIKKGLQMFGDSPIEAIENLSFYPCDLSAIFPGASQNYIYFGGYQMNLSAGSVYKIANPNGHKDLGSLVFNRIYNNWMDFEPYCKLFVSIPYCGEYQLDLSEYYGKTLAVKYFIDTRTGSCCCVLTANGHEVDRFNGQIACQMPIKLTDFSAYANSQINTLLGGGGQALSAGGNTAGAIANAAGTGAVSSAIVAGAAGLGAGLLGITGAKTMYGLAQNNINRYNKTKGGSTSMLNMSMPQTVCFTFEMNKPDIPSNFYQLNGYPSNAGGRVGNFSGYLKCDSVKVSMPGATDAELEKAKALLLSGVYL